MAERMKKNGVTNGVNPNNNRAASIDDCPGLILASTNDSRI